MRRPCVIPKVNGGKPFEALWASVDWCTIDECLYLVTRRSDGFIAKRFRLQLGGFKESLPIRDSIRWQLAQALNPPIEVTKKVFKAMEEVPEANFWYVEGSVNVRLKWDEALKTFTVNGQTPSITDYIQADCPLALQVLLQFNTEGELFNV